MRKLIYSLLAVSLYLTSCISFDEFSPVNYGAGPAIAISVDATVTDSAFTFTITPGDGTEYYSYVVQEATDPIDIDSALLLSGKTYSGVISGVLNISDSATFTSNMRNEDGTPLCLPNTSYYIYAVAANKEGVVGKVQMMSVNTTDILAPKPSFESVKAVGSKVSIAFSDALKRGAGAVTAKYYAEWDLMNPVEVTLADSSISIVGETVTFDVADAPVGSWVCISWEKAAFTDIYGNESLPQVSEFNATTEEFTGVYFEIAKVGFAIKASNFVSPEVGSFFADWTTFKGEIEFAFDIYRIDDKVAKGDLKVVYSNSNKTSTVYLKSTDWSVVGKKIVFKLPSEPAFGDNVDVSISKSVIYDVYGNPNTAYTSTKSKWNRFEFTKAMVLGNFTFSYKSSYDDPMVAYDGGSVTIIEDNSRTNGIIVKNFYLDGSEVPGTYDLTTGKFYIDDVSPLGVTTTSDGTEYGIITYNLEVDGPIEFNINADGTIVCASQMGLAATAPTDYEDVQAYWEKMVDATFTKAVPIASKVKAKSLKTKRVSSIKPGKLNK